jgi:hypothetical protein
MEAVMTIVACTRHATTRAQQRGVTPSQIDAVLRYGDMEALRGGGCSSLWISKTELCRLGPVTPEGVSTDRLHGLIVLQGYDQACVTFIRNRRSKTYRRRARTYRRRARSVR